jgi:CheY-specific phosphatase CheX
MKTNLSHKDDDELIAVMEIVEQRTVSFMREHLTMVTGGTDHRLHHAEGFTLRAMTAIISVGSETGFYIAFSYDEKLIQAVFRRYTAELSIAPEQEGFYVKETAADIINVIIGNCTADLAKQGNLIKLSPPIVMVGGGKIYGRQDATVAALTLPFDEGALDLAFVGPKQLLGLHLDFKGELV